MKTKTIYVADDGTTFDTEKDCIEYEEKLTNKYVVYYKDRETNLIKREFYNEPLVKRSIANCLRDCYEDNLVGDFKIIHRGKTVVFNSEELKEFVPAHYKINGEKLNEVFQLAVARDVKIPGYTLHGDYYLADDIISNKTWKEACEMKKEITLPNGKKVIARILSKEELETIPLEERGISENGHWWYWTRTPSPDDDDDAWTVYDDGSFYNGGVTESSGFPNGADIGGARLGFKNPFLKEKKYSEEVKIPGYTLHGDYYLADKVIPDRNWKEACEMKEEITLPNGKKIIAHILSKEEMEIIPEEQRKINDNSRVWYWTSTPYVDGGYAWYVDDDGGFYFNTKITHSSGYGGARLGFKNPFKS